MSKIKDLIADNEAIMSENSKLRKDIETLSARINEMQRHVDNVHDVNSKLRKELEAIQSHWFFRIIYKFKNRRWKKKEIAKPKNSKANIWKD